jgi:uncharacterized membrane protein YhaH (DUF805 family)
MVNHARMSGEPLNPYAPPKSDWVQAPSLTALSPQQWWLEGDTLVVLRFGTLPTDLCIKTGQPTEQPPVKRKVQWIHPAFAIAVLSPIIFLILFLIFRKTGELTYGVSPEFLQRKKIGLGLILGPIALIVLSAVTQSPIAIVAAMLIFVVCLIVGIVLMTPFQVRKIDKERIYLKVDERFRQALAARG